MTASGDGKKTNYDKRYGLDMPFEDALERFASMSKEEVAAQGGKALDLIAEGTSQMVLFKGAEIRKIFHEGEWWFSLVDATGAISESSSPRRYWTELKKQLIEKDGFSQLFGKIEQLKMRSSDGKEYETDAANTETLFRIIQSIRSPRAEPFKRWLARIAYERIQEIQNPEIAIKRAILTYQIQGRTDDWIEKRVRSIVTRKELTNEWKKRGVDEGTEYAALTNVISAYTFDGISPTGHKRIKGLKSNHNLRDHMTDLELIFTMLGEKSTTEIARAKNARGYKENVRAARAGGSVAGVAREELEKETGEPVVSSKNFLGIEKRTADPVRLTAPKKKPGRG